MPKEQDGEKFDDALARVRRCVGGGTGADNADSYSDIEVVADSVSVNLRCPMTGSRIKIAGRFKPCVHMGCFDLEAFVKLNQRSRKWQCPICLENYSLDNIIIDPYFNRIASLIQSCGVDASEIDVKPDGSWRVKGEAELKDLTQWHLPDGTLCTATDIGSKLNMAMDEHVPPAPRERDIIVLSDSDDDNVTVLSPSARERDIIVLSDSDDDNVTVLSPSAVNCGSAHGTGSTFPPRERDIIVLSDSD